MSAVSILEIAEASLPRGHLDLTPRTLGVRGAGLWRGRRGLSRYGGGPRGGGVLTTPTCPHPLKLTSRSVDLFSYKLLSSGPQILTFFMLEFEGWINVQIYVFVLLRFKFVLGVQIRYNNSFEGYIYKTKIDFKDFSNIDFFLLTYQNEILG